MTDALASADSAPEETLGAGTDDYAGTDPMEVDDPNFLLERLGNDCSNMQVYRELTENSIQAIEEAVRRGLATEGVVEWDYDDVYLQDAGLYNFASRTTASACRVRSRSNTSTDSRLSVAARRAVTSSTLVSAPRSQA